VHVVTARSFKIYSLQRRTSEPYAIPGQPLSSWRLVAVQEREGRGPII